MLTADKVQEAREKRYELRNNPNPYDKACRELAATLSEYVNIGACSQEKEVFAALVTSDHRYLQQKTFELFLACIKMWAEDFEHSQVPDGGKHYDDRNHHAVKCSSEIVKHLRSRNLI